MASQQEWALVFDCPNCGQASRVAAVALSSVLRCPNCRRKVVIDREGMKAAPRRAARTAASTPAGADGHSPAQPAPHRPAAGARSAVGRPHNKSSARGRPALKPVFMLALMVLAAASVAVPAAKLLLSESAADSPAGRQRALVSAAESFLTAWLAGDLQTARAHVSPADRPHFERWSAPRRAALTASFGPRFQGRVTRVQVTESTINSALVQVRFQVRSREQQVFQHWKRTEGEWLLILREERPAGRND